MLIAIFNLEQIDNKSQLNFYVFIFSCDEAQNVWIFWVLSYQENKIETDMKDINFMFKTIRYKDIGTFHTYI